MMTDRALAEASKDANAILLNLTLLWRRCRRREINFTPEGGKFYEDQLLGLRFDLSRIEAEYQDRFAKAYALVDKMSGVLRRHLPAQAKPVDYADLGDILDELKALSAARGIIPPDPTPIAPKAFEGPVYIPDENRRTIVSHDLAAPDGGELGAVLQGATPPAMEPSNVVLFTGVRRERDVPEGAAF